MDRSAGSEVLTPGAALGRRQFLWGIAATGASGLLAACSGSSSSTPSRPVVRSESLYSPLVQLDANASLECMLAGSITPEP